MRFSFLYILLILFCNLTSCQNSIAIDDINTAPPTTKKDQQYANVFKILDGVWEGQFLIFEDHKRLPAKEIDLKNISKSNLQKNGLTQVNSIHVQQTYSSENPYFQNVTIIDHYPDTGQKITSKGVNKIQNGAMWCVVKKPDETVIHEGDAENNTIIWQRNERSPQKIDLL